MDATDYPYLPGALALLEESSSALESLFERFETELDRKTRRAIVLEILHELKVRATIEELMVHPTMAHTAVASGKEKRRHVARLIEELQEMTGGEKRHDAKLARLSANVRRRPGSLEGPGRLPLSLLAFEGGAGPKQQKGPSAGSYE